MFRKLFRGQGIAGGGWIETIETIMIKKDQANE